MSLEELSNKGIALLGTKDNSERLPIIVVGVARGGTSLVAGVLERLGLFMGDKAREPVFEDVLLSSFFESNDDEKVKEIISRYKHEYGFFGWKRPSSINSLYRVDKLFQRPKYVFIFKDIMSIANRNKISMKAENLFPSMEDALKKYLAAIQFIKNNNPDALLLSYEKAMLNPQNFVEALDEFCGLSASSEQIQSAVNIIEPSPAAYLDQSRITKSHGRLGGITRNARHVFGWARFLHQSDRTAQVNLFLNGKRIGEIQADQPREDLDAKFNRPCSFLWELPEHIKLHNGDQLRARVEGDVIDLDNSPLTVEIF